MVNRAWEGHTLVEARGDTDVHIVRDAIDQPNNLAACFPQDSWNWTALSGKANDWRNRGHVLLNLFSHLKIGKIQKFLWWTSEARDNRTWANFGKQNWRWPPAPPCVRSKRPRVFRHHAYMFQHMCAWCWHTRGRFECTHGGAFEAKYGFFSVPQHIHQHTQTHTHTHQTHTTTQHTAHNITRRQRQRKKTEKEDRERRQRKKTVKERQRKRDKTRQDKRRRYKRRRQGKRRGEKREDERQEKSREKTRRENKQDKRRDKMKKKREDERENERENEER